MKISPRILFYIGIATLVIVTLIIKVHDRMESGKKAAVPEKPVGKKIPSCFDHCNLVEIQSARQGRNQRAYFYRSSEANRPLIVSLHTWGGTYAQEDTLALIAKEKNWNYIHPDYGGEQWNDGSCCYTESVLDIDDAIAGGIQMSQADTTKIIVIGKSGGGSGALASYLMSRYSSAVFMAWSPITDYVLWYDEVIKDPDLKNRYAEKILKGTHSTDTLNMDQARLKSPFYMDFTEANYPANKKLMMYSGIRDGLDGWSTSLAQPLLFYNKLLIHLAEVKSSSFIDEKEFDSLVHQRSSPSQKENGMIGDRRLIHMEKHEAIELFIFEGGHEILYDRVIEDLTRVTTQPI